MRFRLLGPLLVQAGDFPVRIAAPKQRTVLALLLARAGHVVPVRSLVAEVWDERPPRSAVANLRTYLMQLRKLLPPAADPAAERLVTLDAGYLLRVEPAEFDLFAFEALSARGRQALARRDLDTAQDAYTRALALWRGPAAEDVPAGPALREVVARLTDQYLSAVEEHTEIQLAQGRPMATVKRLRELIGRYPLRERLYGQLMVALYRCGDVVGALDVFGAARRVLAEELGLDPGPELRRLHQAVLRRDTDLMSPVGPRTGEDAVSMRAGADGEDTAAVRADEDAAAVQDGKDRDGEDGEDGEDAAAVRVGEDVAVVRTGDERPRPRQLPREPVAFVGRSAELARMLTVLCGGPEQGTGPRVLALHGLGGVGKSALALRAAYAVIDRYADGQLYVDLQGSSPGLLPLRPAEVLGRFLRALGMPHGEVPAAPAEAATQYQSLLADRRFLVVLDNAVDAAQVAPLLPAGGGCAALVTSRVALTTMDAEPIAVDVFDEADSVRMLTLLAGRARVDAEAETAADIARWCGYHPLALRIAGARLAGRPDWSLTRFGERLRDQRRRLDELRAADLGVRSCFEVGYAALTSGSGRATDAAARAFRLFGVLAVPEVSVGHVAALLDTGPDVAEDALDELTEARLIEPVGDGRFRMHDLLRLFAAELAVIHDPPAERAQAVRRALDRYLDLCHQVNDLLQPHRRFGDGYRPSRQGSGVDLRSPAEAVRWFETEMPCLIAAAVQVAEREPAIACFVTQLMPLIRALATKGGHWRELEIVAQLAIEVARRHDDQVGEASALAMLGLVDWRAGRPGAAHGHMHRALQLWRELGDREAEGMALHNLGWLNMQTDDLDAALGHITAGLQLLETHASNRVGVVMHNLGEVLLRLGRFTEAAECFERCLTIRRSDRDPLGESITLAALGRAYCLLGRRGEALATLGDALRRCRETGNREDEWEVLLSRSEIWLRHGDAASASADLVRVQELTAQVGNAYGQAAAARQLARARAALGDPAAAEDARRAEELFASPAMRIDPVLERLLTSRL
ncbi:DNA-binding transcriptional activator of the SARP family [Streptosporangium subroseum]|uniref:DNA-binding transcriptional activator of the SARP family n=1 Tax=Streptosporangium subroseum TaxID=106412 RepID=A0A239H4N7_9ACTN|nr:BTAD domain-containing putative transcriptional regulator [Streptosporangium subroseum]SNS76172.1 DNA-binding transcriptional activator of the SARP family [Streptosporangium subroseum]